MSDELLPLQPDQLDELLSAELDGELDAAASDLGLSAADATARISATPGADERRVALSAARELLAEAPRIDDLLATRLRAKAMRAAENANLDRADERKRRRSRILLSAGGIAAAVAAVVALAAGINGSRPGSTSSSSKSSGASPDLAAGATSPPSSHTPAAVNAPPELAPQSSVPALGSFTDVRSLALTAVRPEAIARSRALAGSAKAAAPTSGDHTVLDNGTGYAQARISAQNCAIPPQVPAGATPILRATATLSGKPVVVLVLENRGERVVVTEDVHCALLNLQMLG